MEVVTKVLRPLFVQGREISLIVILCNRLLRSLWCQRLTYSGFSEMNLEPPRQLCRRAFKQRHRWWMFPALLHFSSSPPTCQEPRAPRQCSCALLPCSFHPPPHPNSPWSWLSLNGLGKGHGQQTVCHRRILIQSGKGKKSACSIQ